MFDALKNKLKEKANQAVKIGADAIEAVKLDEERRNTRLAICQSCDQFHNTQFCKLCGCFMPAKTYIPSSRCPINKWTAINNKN